MRYKLICIDLDGTLLCDDKTITNENIEVIRDCSKLRINIAISTGRISKFTKHIIDLLDINAYVISTNGGIIKDINNQYIAINNLDYDDVIKIKEITKDKDIDIYLNTEECVISEGNIYDDYSYKKINEK